MLTMRLLKQDTPSRIWIPRLREGFSFYFAITINSIELATAVTDRSDDLRYSVPFLHRSDPCGTAGTFRTFVDDQDTSSVRGT
jgi:hypothetical protein